MKPDELETLGIRIHGKRWGWQSALAERLKYDRATINKYANGKTAIPRVVALAIRQLAAGVAND
jgi:hypothetical protein